MAKKKPAKPKKAPAPSKHDPTAKNAEGLSPMQERFVHEFCVDLNATQAAIRAGYSQESASERGYEVRHLPSVKAAISKRLKLLHERIDDTAERAALELHRMAYYDPADYTHITCPADIKALPEDVRRAIVGWGWNKNGDFELKFAKVKAIELNGRRHKMFTDKFEIKDTSGLAKRLAAARKRKAK